MPVQYKLVPLAVCAALSSGGCAMLSPQGGHGIATNAPAVGASGALQAAPAMPARAASAVELDALFRLGRHELVAGRPRVAIEHFSALLDREPRHVEALNALGVAVAEMGRLPEAISLLRRAALLAPQAVHVRNNLGHALYRAGDLAQARVELHAALDLQPHNLSALHNLALLDGARTPARPGVQAAPTASASNRPYDGPVTSTAPSLRIAPAPQAAPALQAALTLQAAPALQAAPIVQTAPTPSQPDLRGQADSRSTVQPGSTPAGLAEHTALRILGLDGGGSASAAAFRAGARVAASGMEQAAERRATRGARHGVPPGRRLVVQSDRPEVNAANSPAPDILGLEAARLARSGAAAAVAHSVATDQPAAVVRPAASLVQPAGAARSETDGSDAARAEHPARAHADKIRM